MIKASCKVLTSFLFVTLVICHPAAVVAQSKPVKKAPSALSQKEVLRVPATEMLLNRAELRVIRVDRVGTGAIQPGEVIRTNVWIANSSRVAATVGAASMGPRGRVNRGSSTVTIRANSSAAVRLDIPVEVAQIRDDRFSTLVGIVATNRRSGGWLDQLWQDGNANNNVLAASWAVDPSVYSVRIYLHDFHMHNDCDAGSSDPGEWMMSFSARASDRSFVISRSPAPDGLVSAGNGYGFGIRSMRTLYSGRTYDLNRALNVRPVSSTQMLAVGVWFKEEDWPLGVDLECWGADGMWLTPEQWQRGGNFSFTDWRNIVTLNFSISARPVTIR